jgi:hypothetical protein
MIYFFSGKENAFNFLEYDQDISVDYTIFKECIHLQGVDMRLVYQITKKSGVPKTKKSHCLELLGPTLVSKQLQQVIEKIAPDEAEFFDVSITYEDQKIDGFSAMNLLYATECVDLDKSEFELTNFDPHNPTYFFYYRILQEQTLSEKNIFRCNETGDIVVTEKLKSACKEANLKGLCFERAIDMTPGCSRTICEEI